MDYKEVNQLVNKFWDGVTSLEEEKRLKELIATEENLSAELLELKAYFGALVEEDEALPELDALFEEEVLDKIRTAEKEKSTGFIGIRYLKPLIQVAAAILILFSGVQLFTSNTHDPCKSDPLACADTFEDPEEAYRALKEQLMQVSVMMNNGQGQLTRISKFHEAQTLLHKEKQ